MQKIILSIYPNPGFNPADIHYSDRLESIKLKPKHNPKAEMWVQRLRSASFFETGPKLYNEVLPKLGGIQQISEPTKENLTNSRKN